MTNRTLTLVLTCALWGACAAGPAPAQGIAGALSGQTLRRGARGDAVRALQQQLNAQRQAAGLPAIAVDGAFGPQTEAAVRDFQRSAGLAVDGVVGPATSGALGGGSAAPPPPASTTLQRGANGPEVRALQQQLNAHRQAAGMPPIGVDGAFGPATEAAVQDFQSGAGLPVTGSVDPPTAAALQAAPPPPPPPPSGTRRLNLPARPSAAITGSQLMARVAGQGVSAREGALLVEVQRGNVPSFLRTLVPVTLSGGGHRITVWVTPDYMGVGSDSDWVRFPMTPMAAQRIADRTGCLVPTTRIVDAIYRQAEVKLAPFPLTPDSTMTLPRTFLHHHREIERQRIQQGGRLGQLTAGIKKDVVNTTRLAARPNQVAIYGWHRLSGSAIQPLSLVHGRSYVDYSHGVRLVHATCAVDGVARPLASVLRDPSLARVVSSEGVLRNPRLP